jgi:hypothetical protein
MKANGSLRRSHQSSGQVSDMRRHGSPILHLESQGGSSQDVIYSTYSLG